MKNDSRPVIIQGGMGVGVSGWRLARAVSKLGQLGVVSGVALDMVFARRLQLGDPGGHVRRALESFPFQEMVQRVLDRYFIEGGKAPDTPFQGKASWSVPATEQQDELIVLANFAEVFLAKTGHHGLVGINHLEKVQVPTLPSLYGAMLAGVDYVVIGAGIPRAIPAVLDRLAAGQPVELKLDVRNADAGKGFFTRFDPGRFCQGRTISPARPRFLPIVASTTLATMFARKYGGVDGLIIEGPTAGGHNAPPRGTLQIDERGEPVYGPRDVPDLETIRKLGLPFWLAGSQAGPHRLAEALRIGASGVQVGSAFAFCEESDMRPELKRQVFQLSGRGMIDVFTAPVASPTGFPFKVLQLEGTCSDQAVFDRRTRVCDMGYLQHAYQKPDGTLGFRCPSEPVQHYVRKGGNAQDTRDRKCVCNGLFANIGLGQLRRGGEPEKPLVTAGDDVTAVARFLQPNARSYRAADVIEVLLAGV